MQCSGCATDNVNGAAICIKCGARLTRPARRKRASFDDKYSLIATRVPKDPTTVAAYRCAMIGLIPGLGLPLGGAAIALGLRGMRYFKTDPDAHGKAHAVAAIVLGALELITNGIGLGMIWFGLTAGGS